MFARLCTMIRWLGTAMFVAVLIVWGVAAIRPRLLIFDLPRSHSMANRTIYAKAEGRSFVIIVAKFEVPKRGGTSTYKAVDLLKPLGLYLQRTDTYERPNDPTPYLTQWMFSGHWWHLLALTLPFAARTTQLLIRRRRTRANPTACKSCGYDLRAGHDKCPECGGESHVKVGAANATDNPTAPAGQR